MGGSVSKNISLTAVYEDKPTGGDGTGDGPETFGTGASGGIRADARGNTAVPGLLAAGTARATEPGVYAGGFALMTTSVLGYMAGENAAELLADTPAPTPDTDVEAEFERMFAPLGKSGLHFKEVLRHIQSVVFPYDVSIIKTEESLERARRELVSIIENEVPAMAAEDPHYLLKVLETRAIAFVSLMYVKASLERRETRAGHFREDYPTRNENELAWLCLKKGESTEPDFYRVRVPLEEYRFPVTRYYQDNFTFGKQ